jgi:glycosyltransferase involved in cell wall biosynthesis
MLHTLVMKPTSPFHIITFVNKLGRDSASSISTPASDDCSVATVHFPRGTLPAVMSVVTSTTARETPPGVHPVHPDIGILSLVPSDWEGPWTSRHQVCTRLTRHFRGVWLDPPLGWRSAVRRRRCGAVELDASGLAVYRHGAALAQVYRPAWLGRFLATARLKQAKRVLEAAGCSRTVLYLWRPEFAAALDAVRHDLSVYHIDDEYSFSTTETAIDPAEERLLQRVDQVVIHSPALQEKKGHVNPHTSLIPNGVDYGAYATKSPEPDEYRNIPRPRIGYVGVIKTQIDFELYERLARLNPRWSFVFVGPIGYLGESADALASLQSCRNVFFIGAKSVADLPAYTQHFDVCTMGYKRNDYTKYIYPLKLHEYLATGNPVVATAIRTLQDFHQTIALANTVDEWQGAIETALGATANSPGLREQRRAIAKAHDWSTIVDRLAHTILEGLRRNGG